MTKNYFLSLIALLSFAVVSTAQNEDAAKARPDYKLHLKNSHVFNLGVGFPNVATSALDIATSVAGVDLTDGLIDKVSPQYTLRYEYGVSSALSIGGAFGYYSITTGDVDPTIAQGITLVGSLISDPLGTLGGLAGGGNPLDPMTNEPSRFRLNAYTIAGRFAYHRELIPGIDTYTATTIGFAINKVNTIEGPDTGSLDTDFNAPTFVYTVIGGARYYFTENIGIYGEAGIGSITLVNLGASIRL